MSSVISVTELSTLEERARTKQREYGADALIVCDNLVRIYQVDLVEVQALQGLDLLVEAGEMIAIVGASGSGKSTLLNVLSGLDVPTAGRARVADWDLLRMGHSDRLVYRREVVGFIWQQTGRNLLPYLSAEENVRLPMSFAGVTRKRRAARAAELLEALGVGYCAKRRPGQLSGGEQQRVSIAVALANRPQVLFADEPTGELDTATSADVFAALRAANTDLGATVVIVTHDVTVSEQVQRTVADSRRSHQLRGAAPHRHRRPRPRPGHRRGVRRPRPLGPAPAPAGVSRRPRAGASRPPRAGARSRRGVARRHTAQGTVRIRRVGGSAVSGQDGFADDEIVIDEELDSRPETPGRPLPGPSYERETGPMIDVHDLTRTYGSGSAEVHAVRSVSFTVERGELTTLVGRSGSGKTTLLNCIGGLDSPTSGSILVAGREVTGMGERELADLRRDTVAFIFQTFGLVPVLSAAENIGLPLRLRRVPTAERQERTDLLLELVGLAGHAHQRPAELSGGQQQRVAIARALANQPRLLIADEPTGQLDSETGRAIMELIRAVVRAEGMTALVSTHDAALVDLSDRTLQLADGQLVADSDSPVLVPGA